MHFTAESYVSIAHAVTASPSLRQDSGFLSFLLHSMKDLLCLEQRAARCFEMDMRTAEVGGGVSSSVDISGISAPPRTIRYDLMDHKCIRSIPTERFPVFSGAPDGELFAAQAQISARSLGLLPPTSAFGTLKLLGFIGRRDVRQRANKSQ